MAEHQRRSRRTDARLSEQKVAERKRDHGQRAEILQNEPRAWAACLTARHAAAGLAIGTLALGRRQTPIILSTARGNFVTMLIRILTESTFRDGRLPEGLVVSARPNANGSGVDLSFDTVGQHPIAAAG